MNNIEEQIKNTPIDKVNPNDPKINPLKIIIGVVGMGVNILKKLNKINNERKYKKFFSFKICKITNRSNINALISSK